MPQTLDFKGFFAKATFPKIFPKNAFAKNDISSRKFHFPSFGEVHFPRKYILTNKKQPLIKAMLLEFHAFKIAVKRCYFEMDKASL